MEADKNQAIEEVDILFVDDEEIMHRTIERYLKGWNVHYAFNAEEALEIIGSHSIQIVIADISMPGLSGIELTRRIKAISGFIQVIIITATLEVDNLLNAMEAGANDFILKPLKKQQLLEAIGNTNDRLNRWRTVMANLFRKRRKS